MQLEHSANFRTRQQHASPVMAVIMFVGCALIAASTAAAGPTVDRIKQSGHIKLGYIGDASPFSANGSDGPEGYAITLCQRVVASLEKQLAQDLTVDWTLVAFDRSLRQVEAGAIDLLCVPTVATLSKRQDVSFSIPIFGGGNRAVIRADAPSQLRNALSEQQITRPVWRGTPAATLLEKTTFVVTKGTTTEKWLQSRREFLNVDAKILPVADYRMGLQMLRDRKADVFFGERSLVVGALGPQKGSSDDLVILDRLFTHEPLALAMGRGDDDFRVSVDRALSQLYASEEFPKLYTKWLGPVDTTTRTFFQFVAMSE
jgi:polar amino acid transport system substrate-binding protein